MSPCQTNHRIIYGGISVRVQFHRFADDVCGLRGLAAEQTFFIHGIKKFSVRGLESVNFGNGAADDNAYRIRKIVFFQRIYDLFFFITFRHSKNTPLRYIGKVHVFPAVICDYLFSALQIVAEQYVKYFRGLLDIGRHNFLKTPRIGVHGSK